MGYYTDYDLGAYYYKNDPCCSQVITGNLHGDLLKAVRDEIEQMNVFEGTPSFCTFPTGVAVQATCEAWRMPMQVLCMPQT